MHTEKTEIYTALTVAGLVMGVIIIVFIISMIRHQRRYVHFYNIKIKAEIETLEKERRRIATDIHDELGPTLSAIRMHINLLKGARQPDTALIDSASQMIDNILARTREISYNLLPSTLERSGLIAAVADFSRRQSETHSLKIDFDGQVQSKLPPDVVINSYRICQEVIHNTVKHAKASRLKIRILEKDKKLYIHTADDGIGFNMADTISDSRGIGLLGLQSRADILGGKFLHNSYKNKGTQYTFIIPI